MLAMTMSGINFIALQYFSDNRCKWQTNWPLLINTLSSSSKYVKPLGMIVSKKYLFGMIDSA